MYKVSAITHCRKERGKPKTVVAKTEKTEAQMGRQLEARPG